MAIIHLTPTVQPETPKNSKARIEANAKFDKKTYKHYHIKINKIRCADLIEWIDSKDNKNDYIVELIKNDMSQKK